MAAKDGNPEKIVYEVADLWFHSLVLLAQQGLGPEQVLAELNAAGASDSDINKITWENSCRFFGWDPFKLTPKDQATSGALRAKATDVDVSIRPRAEWARLYDQKQFART